MNTSKDKLPDNFQEISGVNKRDLGVGMSIHIKTIDEKLFHVKVIEVEDENIKVTITGENNDINEGRLTDDIYKYFPLTMTGLITMRISMIAMDQMILKSFEVMETIQKTKKSIWRLLIPFKKEK